MRVRAVLAAVGLVLAGMAGPATAAPSGTLTLQGSTTAWTTFDVPADITIEDLRMSVTSKGAFGGYYLDFGGEHNIGSVWFRDFQPPGETGGHAVGLGSHGPQIARGRYRIYLIADGPTTVRIPVKGMASRTVRPTTRATATGAVEQLQRDGLGVSGRQPLTAGRRSVSLSTIMLDDTMVFAGTIRACLTRPEGDCDSGGQDHGRWGWYVNPYGAYPFVWAISYAPGVKSGRLDAVQGAENVAGISFAVGASFTLALA